MSLQPSDVRVDVGSWASFNCTLPCDFSQTHTINWFIGESPVSRRNVYLSINNVSEREFEEYTGIQIELRDASNCGTVMSSGQQMVKQQLRVFVSTAQAINRTAVQCAALRKDPANADMYSIFGVILVNGMYYISSEYYYFCIIYSKPLCKSATIYKKENLHA